MPFVLLLAGLFLLLQSFNFANGYGARELGEECEPRRIKERYYDEPYSTKTKSYSSPTQSLNYGRDTNYRQNYFRQGNSDQTNIDQHGYGRDNYNKQSYVNSSYYQIPEHRKCRSEKGLHCNRWTRKCACRDLSGAEFNYLNQRCELAIDHFCTTKTINFSHAAEHGGLEYEHFCPDDAQCTCDYNMHRRYWKKCEHANGLCKCKYLYRPHLDNRGCWYSKGNRGATDSVILKAALPLVGLLTRYIYIV